MLILCYQILQELLIQQLVVGLCFQTHSLKQHSSWNGCFIISNTTGAQNTAVGANALDANVGANNLTAVGYNALTSFNKKVVGDAKTVGIGTAAFHDLTTGTQKNTAVGYQAGYAQTSTTDSAFFVSRKDCHDITMSSFSRYSSR